MPDRVAIPDVSREGAVHNVAWETISTDLLATNPSHWHLAPGAAWHGFPDLAPGFAMTDPEQADAADARASTARPATTPSTASPLRSSRNICARTASWRKRTISTRCSSCSRPASRPARPAR